MQAVLLTGATGNLGQAVTKKLISKNYVIEAAAGRSLKDLPRHENFNACPVDLLDEKAAESFVQQAITRQKNLSAGILLVGGFATGDMAITDMTAIDKMIAINFKTAWNITQPLFQHFAQIGGGQIIFVGTRSLETADTSKNVVAYTLSKSLVSQLARIINEAGKAFNVTATLLVPGTIDTPQNRAAMPEENHTNWVTPEAIADTIAFVLTNSGKQMRESVLKLYNKI